ncbi:MAG: metal-dependent transcriptional regulator [Ignavibacteriae bacterium]|nr:metal-dependent transcriptional regulator [Ignavibacteriota bacterium]NOG96965.1 metal-dependent transcriptional regulator [Ignavibacteriota bacterium]
MVDPITALIFAGLSAAVLVVLFLPKKGIAARLRRSKLDSKRVLIEDALKHIYDCEYNKSHSSINSVAGNLNISTDAAAKLISRLEEMGLVVSETSSINLTAEGRSYALRVIRIHRVWEKYLSEETGVSEMDWHDEAEIKEHTLTIDEANDIAKRLNNPLFDPHGDPIPSSTGQLPKKIGIPISDLKTGEFAHIIHLEDEPNSIYAQILAMGLYPGMQVRMISASNERVVFEANSEEKVLTPLFAQNISVQPTAETAKVYEDFKLLSSLNKGEEASVLGISKACRGKQRRRLMDLGFVPGTKISTLMKSIGGDPIAFQLRGTTIALRKSQADLIFIK